MLEEFLCNCKDQTEMELLSLDFTKNESTIKAAKYIEGINLLGAIIRLPKIVAELKRQFDEVELRNIKMQENAEDPLDKEGV